MARSEKQIKEIGAAVGWISEFLGKLVAEVKRLGGMGWHWHRLTTVDGQETIKEIAKLIVNPPPGIIREVQVRSIDLGRKPDEILEAGGYAVIYEDIRRFSIDGIHGDGAASFELYIIEFPEVGEPNSTHNVRERMKKRGLKPAAFAKLLAFGQGIDDLVRRELGQEFQVVALGSSVAGPRLAQTYAGVSTLKDGRVIRQHDFLHHAEALEAVGLSD